MAIKSVQKVIKIGTSLAVTLPARDARNAGIAAGQEVEITVRKGSSKIPVTDSDVLDAAKNILKRYKKDFENLAKR